MVKHPPGERIPEATEPMARQEMERYFRSFQKPYLCWSSPDHFDHAEKDGKGEYGNAKSANVLIPAVAGRLSDRTWGSQVER